MPKSFSIGNLRNKKESTDVQCNVFRTCVSKLALNAHGAAEINRHRPKMFSEKCLFAFLTASVLIPEKHALILDKPALFLEPWCVEFPSCFLEKAVLPTYAHAASCVSKTYRHLSKYNVYPCMHARTIARTHLVTLRQTPPMKVWCTYYLLHRTYNIHTQLHTYIHTCLHTNIHASINTHRQTSRQTKRQTDRQEGRHPSIRPPPTQPPSQSSIHPCRTE